MILVKVVPQYITHVIIVATMLNIRSPQRVRKMEPLDPIWQNLPDDLAFLIISYLNIDTRRAFGLKPQRNRLPNFDFKIKPPIWTELYNGFALYCEIKKNNKNLTGKIICEDHVDYLTFISPTHNVPHCDLNPWSPK